MAKKAFDLIVLEIDQMREHIQELYEKILRINDVIPVVDIGKLERYIVERFSPICKSMEKIKNALGY